MTAQTMPAVDRTPLLRRAIQADSLICLAGGALLAVGSAALAGPLGIPAVGLLSVGLALLPWGAWLWYVASRPTISRRAAWAIIILNALWVIDSLALLASGWLPLTTAGWWLVLAQAVAGGVAAEVQYIALRRA